MKKVGFIAASIATAGLLAAGAAAIAHFATHPGGAIEEANASEVAPARGQKGAAPGEAGNGSRWGVLGWFMGDGGGDRAQQADPAPASPPSDDDDDDDDD